jgi:4-nitrophenol 2-monooxygenase / 4-nitrocatechol 4-monooxygenase, reductase component
MLHSLGGQPEAGLKIGCESAESIFSVFFAVAAGSVAGPSRTSLHLALDEESVRDALARLPAGVVLVSTRSGDAFRGITATSFTAVSLEPPLVLVCLDRFAATRDAVLEHGAFTASLLSRGQQFFADRFSGQAPAADAAWREVPHSLGENGLPIVEGAVAWIECRVEASHAAGDHDIVIGAVTAVGSGGGEPLVHWERGYWSLTRTQ